MFKSGFVNIIGRPNTGKSTLMNALVGEQLSIITPKAQTTRRRILGIVRREDAQIIFSDTPGYVVDPQYKLHEWMNEQIGVALQDADILLYLVTPDDPVVIDEHLLEKLRHLRVPFYIVINKSDTVDENGLKEIISQWKSLLDTKYVFGISALHHTNLDSLQQQIMEDLPVHPPYFDPDELTDQTERFFAAEIIREKIFMNYRQEIPYSVETIIEEYKDKGDMLVIKATIFAGKESHKNIIIGKSGAGIKKTGTEARKSIEALTGRKVYLELFVKVKEDWKNDERMLKYFGYH